MTFHKHCFIRLRESSCQWNPSSGWGKSINLLGFNGKCYITYRKYYGTIMVFWTWYYGKCCIAYKKLPLYYHKSDTTYKNTMLLLCFLGYSTMANVRSHTKRCHCTTIKVMPLTKIPWCYYVFLGYSTMANVRSHTKRCHCTTIKVMPLTKIPWCYYVFLGGHGTIW